MAYGFPVGYQQYYPNTFNNYPINQNVGATQNSALIWVQGEAGAKSYMVAPNQTVTLWDSEQNIIYIKSADASGMPAIKILDYTIRENSTQKTNKAKLQDDFATKEDVSKEIKRLEEMIREIKKPNASSEQAL
jgi:hypothetical protein